MENATVAVVTIEGLMSTLGEKITALNAATTRKDYDSAKDAMDKALSAVNAWHVNARAVELSAMDVDAMYSEYIDAPYTTSGVRLKTDKETGKVSIDTDPVKVSVSFKAVVEANTERTLVKPNWEKAISVLRYTIADCDSRDTKAHGHELCNPLTITEDLRLYASTLGVSLQGKTDKSGKLMGVSRAYLKDTVIPAVARELLPESVLAKFKVCSADVNYLIKAVCPAKSTMHDARVTVRRNEAVTDEFFTAVKTRIHNLAYAMDAEGKKNV